MDWIKKNKLTVFLILASILAGGLVYAGMQIGKRQSQITVLPTPFPTEVLVPTETPTSSPSTPTPDPTAGWKTYVSQDGHFLFKYPPIWPFVKGKFYQGDILAGTLEKVYFGTSDPQADNKPDEGIVFMAVYKDSSIFGKTPEEYLQIIGDSIDSTTQKEVTIGGVSGIRVLVKGMYPFSDTVVFSRGGYLYRFELLDNKATNKNRKVNEQIFDQILSTFKFLK